MRFNGVNSDDRKPDDPEIPPTQYIDYWLEGLMWEDGWAAQGNYLNYISLLFVWCFFLISLFSLHQKQSLCFLFCSQFTSFQVLQLQKKKQFDLQFWPNRCHGHMTCQSSVTSHSNTRRRNSLCVRIFSLKQIHLSDDINTPTRHSKPSDKITKHGQLHVTSYV